MCDLNAELYSIILALKFNVYLVQIRALTASCSFVFNFVNCSLKFIWSLKIIPKYLALDTCSISLSFIFSFFFSYHFFLSFWLYHQVLCFIIIYYQFICILIKSCFFKFFISSIHNFINVF